MAHSPFEIIVDGRTIELTEENHGLAMFRDMPDADYIDITEYVGPNEDETEHTVLFRQREVMIWMGHVCLLEGDAEVLESMEEMNGPFRARTGFNSRAYIEDAPNDFEMDMLAKSLSRDLQDTIPQEWEVE